MSTFEQFNIRGQTYTFNSKRPHRTRDGREVDLLIYSTACPNCGCEFEIAATRTAVKRRELSRRCRACRSPGVRVTSTLAPVVETAEH